MIKTIRILVFSFLLASLCSLARADEATPTQWAVLIGVTEHKESSRFNLRFTDEDVRLMREVLFDHAGIPLKNMLVLSIERNALEPTKQNMIEAVREFLKKPGPNDRVFVYFSGHGVIEAGETYLVPSDFESDRIAETAVPAATLRDILNGCRAETKFFVLDCCHAAGTKSLSTAPSSSAIAKGLDIEGVKGCFVLASCKEEELSIEWSERKQGLFSFWLARALQGGANTNSDAELKFSEIYDYVHERVSQTARVVFERDQTPMRINSPSVGGNPVMLSLQPEKPETVCRRLAEELDLEIRRHNLSRVLVLEFHNNTSELENVPLNRYCSELISSELRSLANGAYLIATQEDLAKSMSEQHFTFGPKDTGNPLKLSRLKEHLGVDGVVSGPIERAGYALLLESRLYSLDGTKLTSPTGRLPLCLTTLADTGTSINAIRHDIESICSSDAVDRATEEATRHPLFDPKFPITMTINTVQRNAQGEVIHRSPKDFIKTTPDAADDLSPQIAMIEAREGELFEIEVQHSYGDNIEMVLLVDGLNTIGKNIARTEAGSGWIIKPNTVDRTGGFYLDMDGTASPSNGKVKKRFEYFQFVDVNHADASRMGYSDKIGLISATFFAKGGDKAVGTAGIPSGHRILNTVRFKRGDYLGTLHIRYVEAE